MVSATGRRVRDAGQTLTLKMFGPADFLDAQGHDVPIMAWIPVRDNSDRQERACKDMVGKSVCQACFRPCLCQQYKMFVCSLDLLGVI